MNLIRRKGKVNFQFAFPRSGDKIPGLQNNLNKKLKSSIVSDFHNNFSDKFDSERSENKSKQTQIRAKNENERTISSKKFKKNYKTNNSKSRNNIKGYFDNIINLKEKSQFPDSSVEIKVKVRIAQFKLRQKEGKTSFKITIKPRKTRHKNLLYENPETLSTFKQKDPRHLRKAKTFDPSDLLKYQGVREF
jgi:hypothetical protein